MLRFATSLQVLLKLVQVLSKVHVKGSENSILFGSETASMRFDASSSQAFMFSQNVTAPNIRAFEAQLNDISITTEKLLKSLERLETGLLFSLLALLCHDSFSLFCACVPKEVEWRQAKNPLSGGLVYLDWQHQVICMDDGLTLLAVWSAYADEIPGMATTPEDIGFDSDVLISRSLNGGATWTPVAALNTNGGCPPPFPKIITAATILMFFFPMFYLRCSGQR